MLRCLLLALLMGFGMLDFIMAHVIRDGSSYPLTSPLKSGQETTFNISIISDLDSKATQNGTNSWVSFLKKGSLSWNPTSKNPISITWTSSTKNLTSKYAVGGRGMELSELVTSNGKILSFDDKTGLVYSIENDEAYPWIILMDGNGTQQKKGFKSEWATVKNGDLYVGSTGNEFVKKGRVVHRNQMWVKVISTSGTIQSFNWFENFVRLRRVYGIESPGYMTHEAVQWSDILKKWVFLPRKCSTEQYDEVKDENLGCSVLILVDENFTHLEALEIKNVHPERGFSSFKFLPGSNDTIIIALRTLEANNSTATYITGFTIEGTILMDDTLIEEEKFEGFEFI